MTPYCLMVFIDALEGITRTCSTPVVDRVNTWVASRYTADRPALRGVVQLDSMTVKHLGGEYPVLRVTYYDESAGDIEEDLQEYAKNLIKNTPVNDFLSYLAAHPA